MSEQKDSQQHQKAIDPQSVDVPEAVIELAVTDGLLTDSEIEFLIREYEMISDCSLESIKTDDSGKKIISYGLTSMGYDVRCAPEFKVFSNVNNVCVDPKEFDENATVDVNGEVCIIPPNSFVLGRTVEHFNIPEDVMGLCISKSTYARCGMTVTVTPLQPNWKGHLVLEFANTTNLPMKLYANEGCAMIMFFRTKRKPNDTYRDGKYQGQTGITLPR